MDQDRGHEERKEWLGRGWAFPVALDPRTGGIALVEHETDVRQAIRIILETRRGERVMRPEFGCGIHDLVFDVIDMAMLTRIETEVREALLRFEARIDVLDVRADPVHATEGTLLVEIEYRVRRTNQTGNFVFPFYFREGGSMAEVFRR
ncbi:MAG: GPW/gp25 family protein [Rhodobacter sp.]|nr:GPW/gp25 family protein [Rhodobacter sp.]MCA3456683.1 GPW/gp25 family protein [Rhodobacter sp.]